jgi:hypothetical protein
MKIRMLVDNRVVFTKGSIVDVEEVEANRLLSLGFAEKVEAPKVETPKVVETKKTRKSKED